MLGKYPDIRVVGEASSVASARSVVRETVPDIVFLDIHLGRQSGFDLLPLDVPKARIIFVTAYDVYAVRAFEVNALDYLLKPVSDERLKNALQRVERSARHHRFHYEDQLYVRTFRGACFVPLKTIVAVCSAGDYTELVVANRDRHLMNRTMAEWDSLLPERFVRIHRSMIVNTDYVERIDLCDNYTGMAVVSGVGNVPVSRRYAARFHRSNGAPLKPRRSSKGDRSA